MKPVPVSEFRILVISSMTSRATLGDKWFMKDFPKFVSYRSHIQLTDKTIWYVSICTLILIVVYYILYWCLSWSYPVILEGHQRSPIRHGSSVTNIYVSAPDYIVSCDMYPSRSSAKQTPITVILWRLQYFVAFDLRFFLPSLRPTSSSQNVIRKWINHYQCFVPKRLQKFGVRI